jgi:hypothetical protein
MSKAGRPKLPKNKARTVFSIRCSPDERKRMEKAAKRARAKLSEWARNELLAAASHDISSYTNCGGGGNRTPLSEQFPTGVAPAFCRQALEPPP